MTDDGTKKRKLRTLTGLDVERLRHPSDARATDVLRKIPGLDKAMAKLLEYGLERLVLRRERRVEPARDAQDVRAACSGR